MKAREGGVSPENSAPETAIEGTLTRLGRALPDLAARLDRAGLPVGPDRWQNLYDLLLELAARGRLPADVEALEPLVAPLFCRSGTEQRQFREAFRAWAAALAPTDVAAHPGRTGTGPADAPPTPPPARLHRWWLALALLLVASVAALYWHNTSDRPEPPAQPPTAEKLPPAPQPDPGATVPTPPKQTSEPRQVPPRSPLPAPVLDPLSRGQLRFLGHLCLLLPPFVALSWLLLRFLTWRTVLERRRGDGNDPLVGIRLDPGADDLLDAPALRETVKRLHMPVPLPTRRLDSRATVARTARHAGLFQPMLRQRRAVPELVVLVETRDAGDQVAGLAGQLVDRLRAAGLIAHRFDFRYDPRRVVGPDGRWFPLAEVAARHEGARLLLVGDALPLIEPFTGRPQSWTRVMHPWPERGLLATRSPPLAWEQALDAAGFALAEISSAGVQALALRLGGLRPVGDLLPETSAPPLPRLIQDAGQWSQPVPLSGKKQQALLQALDAYLGADGSELMSAVATYPQLHWGLTRVLDLHLFPLDDALSRERRLLRLLRLPWLRRGWLPDWLREALLDRLGRRGHRRLRLLYRRLLQQATGLGDRTFALPVSLPEQGGVLSGLWRWLCERGWRADRWFRALRVLAPDHGVLNDAIFADVLFGWRPRLLDFTVARRLLRRHIGGALGQALAPRLLLALLLGFGGAWLADRAWHQWLREQHAEPWLMQRQQRMHGDHHVRIWHRAETEPLALALRAALSAEGFAVAIQSEPLVLPEGSAPPEVWKNQIQRAASTDDGMAEHVADRLRYLTWGTEPEHTGLPETWAHLPVFWEPLPAGELRVFLSAGGTTRARFRDTLGDPLTDAQRLEFSVRDDERPTVQEEADPKQTAASITAAEQERLVELQAANRPLVALSEELWALERIKPTVRTDAQKARIGELRIELHRGDRRFQDTLDRIFAAFESVDSSSRRDELALKQLDNDLRGLVADLSEQAGTEVALIHYLVLAERLYILLTLPKLRLAKEVAVGEADLNREIQALREALQDPRSDPRAPARAFHERLIKPIAADLQGAGVKHLMLYLDGALRYLPLAALYDGERYLVERYSSSVYTAAAERNLKDASEADWTLAALGLSRAIPGFAPLPTVPAELEAIVKRNESDPDGVLPGRIFLDEDFTAKTLQEALEDGYRVMHLASHLVLRPGTESDSFLLLGDGNRLDLGELRLGDYVFGKVDLLTLSASYTAIGGQGADGREVESLATLFQKKGTKGVLGTLWQVSDQANAIFFQSFYRGLAEGGLTKAEALRRAQLAFLTGQIEGNAGEGRATLIPLTADGDQPESPAANDYRRHPYYWAPYILMGNWL